MGEYLNSFERGCEGKISLGRRSDYRKQAWRLARKHGKTFGVYECAHCGRKHLTTKVAGPHSNQLLFITNWQSERS